MIAQRFKSVAWVIGVACAATLLYTVSLRVANERARLDALEEKIAFTKREIRRLQTELGARGSLRQLERWNGEVLALSAPDSKQYLPSESALARVDAAGSPAKGYVPAPVMITSVTPATQVDLTSAQAEHSQTTAERVAVLERSLTGKAPQSVAGKAGNQVQQDRKGSETP